MRIAIIANNFQEDYIVELLNCLSGKGHEIDFIGSSVYKKENLVNPVNFLNFRSYPDETTGVVKKGWLILVYYFRLLRYFLFSRCNVIHIQWLKFNFFEGFVFGLCIRLAGKKQFIRFMMCYRT
ncbi:MAG: hypothetical protein HC906_12435 [Bacteroidales bacterium]|nr:hypothetical protein [Bacteroidales bacterium]